MNQEHVLGDPAELAALYLTGALTFAERAGFEAHVEAGCEVCDVELRRLDRTTAALLTALEPLPPKPEMKANLLKRVAAQPRRPESPSPLLPQVQRDTPPPGPGP